PDALPISDERRYGRWRTILRDATEQSGRGVVPDLLSPQTFAAAIEGAAGTVLVAALEPGSTLRDALRERAFGGDESGTICMFVGPEGGFTSDEIEFARAAGAHLVTLGSRV